MDLQNNIKIYEVDENSELEAISLVEYPAVETNFVALNKEEKKKEYITLEQGDKHIVYGCALRADYPIYRYDGENEYYIKFTPKAIERMAREYMVKGYDNWTIDHEKDTEGIHIIESWIKTDKERDKSLALGLDDVEVGSWFIGAYINNTETWEKIKQGEWGGFSVEAWCDLVEAKFKKDDKMEVNESFWEQLKSVIKDAMGLNEEEKAEEQLEAEAIVEEALEEDKKEEEVVEDNVEEMVVEDKEDAVEETVKEELNSQVIDALTNENNELKKTIEELKLQLEAIKKEPSVEKLDLNKEESNKGSNFDRMLSIMNGTAFQK